MRGTDSTPSLTRTDEDSPNWLVLVLTFVAVVLDGYDTIALGLSVPALARDWGVAPSHFTPALSLTSAGVALGYLACGGSSPGSVPAASCWRPWWCSPSVRC